MMRVLSFCLAAAAALAALDSGRALAAPLGLDMARAARLPIVEEARYRRSHRHVHPHWQPYTYSYYGAERPDGYYGYGFRQPYRPYAFSR
jgi:hypothetical protein